MKKLKYLLFIPALILAFIFPINTLYALDIGTSNFETIETANVNGNRLYIQEQEIISYLDSFIDDTLLVIDNKIELTISDNIVLDDYIKYIMLFDVGDGYIVFINSLDEEVYSFDYELNTTYKIRTEGTSSRYEEGYRDGYLKGQDEYDNGYNEAKGDYGIYYEGEWLTADQYAVIKVNEKVDELGDLELSIVDFVPGILGAIFSFFFTLSSMSILGISILDILILVFGLGAVIFVIKLFIK